MKHPSYSRIIKTKKLLKKQDKNQVYKDQSAKRNKKLSKTIVLLIFKYHNKSYKINQMNKKNLLKMIIKMEKENKNSKEKF